MTKVTKAATVDDVARLAGVSNATVSRVLNHARHVAPETRERVTEAVRQLRFSPNKFARGLAANRADGIGVVIPEFTDPYHGALLQAIEQFTREKKLQVTAVSSHRSTVNEREAIRFLHEQSYNVIILSSSTLSTDEFLDLEAKGITCFQIGRKLASLANRSLYLDDVYGGRLAAEYLLTKGHRQIAHVASPQSPGVDIASLQRSQGFRRALESADLSYDDTLTVQAESFDEIGGYQATKVLLERNVAFTALFVSTDRMAMGAYQALNERGLHIPNDVSVIGYDGIEFAAFMQPALTTVQQPIEEIGKLAAQLAIEHLRGTPKQACITPFQPRLLVRKSVRGVMSP